MPTLNEDEGRDEQEVSDAEVERQRRLLSDVSGDGGGSIGAAEDGRARSQPEGEGEARPRQMDSRGEGEEENRRQEEESLAHEGDRLTRR